MDFFKDAKMIVDSTLFIHTVDKEIYQHVNNMDIYSSVKSILHPDDFELLRNEVLQSFQDITTLGSNFDHKMLAVRVLGNGEDYDWYITIVRPISAIISERTVVELEFINYRYLTSKKDEENLASTKYTTLLGLYESFYFEYSLKEDTITIHSFINEVDTVIASEKLDDWSSANSAKYASSANSIGFLVNNLRNSFSNFQMDMPNSEVFGSSDSYPVKLNCRTLKRGANSITFGTIVPFSSIEGKDIVALNTDYDPLLNILNKKSIIEYAKKSMARPNASLYLVIFDLDNFKNVNDNFGHMEGDRVLCEVATIVKEQIRGYGVVGRIGGDELMIILEDIEDKITLRNVLRNIRTKIEVLYKTKPRDYGVTCSMGTAKYPDYADNYEDLFKLSDKMLYIAKQKGKNRYILYVPELHANLGVAANQVTIDPSKVVTFPDKLKLSKAIIEDYLTRRIITNATIVSLVGSTYQLDDIHLVYNNFETTLRYYKGETSSDVGTMPRFFDIEELEPLYDEVGLIYITGLFKIKAEAPKFCKFLQDNNLESVVVYKLKTRKQTDGYIIFGKGSTRYQWSNEELLMFTLFGKAFELAMYNLS